MLIISVIAVAAVAASDRQKPLLVDSHSSGEWAFNNASDGIRDDAHVWLQTCDPIAPDKDLWHPNNNKVEQV